MKLLKSQKNLHLTIEEIVWKYDISFIDAIIHYCEENGFDIETIGEIAAQNPILLSKLQEEAEKLNFLEKKIRLPI